jgi:hypothetical protein
MSWKKERDLLIAQALVFVQSVSAKKPDLEPATDAAPNVETAPIAVMELASEIVDPPKDARVTAPIPRTTAASDFRTEIEARIAHFRTHQERFHREREKYFSATLARVRAEIGIDSPPLR